MNNAKTAFHAAGHVVMTLLWGVWRIDKVSLADRGNSGDGIEYACIAETEGKKLSLQPGSRLFNAKLERMMGGPIAQAIRLGVKVVYKGDKRHSDFDCLVSEMQKGGQRSSPKEVLAIIHEHEPVVQADLKRMWPVVEALARELMNKKELSEYEIRSIVRTAVNQLPEDERNWAISRLRNTPPR